MLRTKAFYPAVMGALCLSLLACGPRVASAPDADWDSYEGGAGAAHYSTLSQITAENVDRLEVAWTYELGEGSAISSPLIIGGRLYAIGGQDSIVALDAATGAELWKRPGLGTSFMRGLMYWADGADRRILYTKDNHLRALNADDGADIAGFDVDLRLGLERDPETIRRVQSNTPGRVFEDLLIMGTSPGENYGSPVGDIRAYDVRTGALRWTFHTIPRRGEPGYETWPDTNPRTRHGGANAWGGLSVDEERGIVYANTGSATYDFWGVDRPGDNLYADCLLAINARTGELIWHFQLVHHDLWDYEAAATPTLMTIQRDGAPVDVVAVAGKTGFLYVFNRVTGEPIWPIPETPVPTTGGMPGERISPTQPIPSFPEPFARMTFTAEDVDPAIPEPDRSEWIERVRAARNDGIFTPPSERPTVQMPGSNGGANYGSTAADLANGRFYVISSDQPAIIQLENVREMRVDGPTPFARGQIIYQENCAMCHGADLAGIAPAPSLIGVQDRLNGEQLRRIISEGGQRMPAFPTIVGGAYWDLMAYFSGDRTVAPQTPPRGRAAVTEEQRWRTDFGYLFYSGGDRPVMRPPWATLTAYDLNTGEKLFTTVVGTNPAYPIAGVRTGLPLTKIGPIVTAGGLVFAATSLDRRLEALDASTGDLLWSGELPAAALGIPATYAVNGRQYVVVTAAASGSRGSHEPDGIAPARNAYVAFALPERMIR